jgi:serine/threonine-protein phosphatase 2A regulatory subunit A
MMHLSE